MKLGRRSFVGACVLGAWAACASGAGAGAPEGVRSDAATGTFAPGYVAAVGGGDHDEGTWAREVFAWMVAKVGKGPVVIIGSSPPPDEPDPPELPPAPGEPAEPAEPAKKPPAPEPDSRIEMFKALGVERVESLDLHADNADLQSTYDTIAACRIVYIRGGSQSRYVEFWKGTRTEAAIRKVFNGGGAVGGTSAGCAILGEVSYDALNGSLSTAEILRDARHPELTLTKGFLGLTPNVLFDTHFTQRGRIGRLAVMLATLRTDDRARRDVLGIGVDEKTALCIDRDGTGLVIGEGCVNLVRLGSESRIELPKGEPPLVMGAVVSRAPAGFELGVAEGRLMCDWGKEVHDTPPTLASAPVLFSAGDADLAAESVTLRGRVWSGERAGAKLTSVFRELADGESAAFLLDAGSRVRLSGEDATIEAEGTPTSVVVFRSDGSLVADVPPGAAKLGIVRGVRMDIVPPGGGWTW